MTMTIYSMVFHAHVRNIDDVQFIHSYMWYPIYELFTLMRISEEAAWVMIQEFVGYDEFRYFEKLGLHARVEKLNFHGEI